MMNTSYSQLMYVHDSTSPQNEFNHSQRVDQNTSLNEGCIQVVFSEMEYLPWDNPDNIVSAEVETVVRRIKNNLLVLLFLFGGPANLLNMAVFYKQSLGDRVNLCLFALSLADEVYLIVCMVMHGEQLHVQFTTKESFGPIMTFWSNNNLVVFTAASYISYALSAIIATERCLCILNPLRFQALLRTRTMAAIIVVVSVMIVGLFFIVVFRYRVGCVYDPLSGIMVRTATEGTFYRTHKKIIDSLHSFVFGFGLPGIEMIVVFITTLITIVKLRQVVMWRSGISSVISAREVALTKNLVANSIFFMACSSPSALIRFSLLPFPEMSSGRRQHSFFLVGIWTAELFMIINSTFNFCVYFAMGSRFRETFWALFSRNGKTTKQ